MAKGSEVIWRRVIGYKTRYLVSDDGRLRSLRMKDFRVMSPCFHRAGGYPMYGLWNGRHKTFTIHQLVLEAFVGKAAPGMVCRHLDGDPLNNRLANLVWGTYKENSADRKMHGTEVMGEHHPTAKLTEKQVLKIRRLYAKRRISQKALALIYGLHQVSISEIVTRKTWKHI